MTGNASTGTIKTSGYGIINYYKQIKIFHQFTRNATSLFSCIMYPSKCALFHSETSYFHFGKFLNGRRLLDLSLRLRSFPLQYSAASEAWATCPLRTCAGGTRARCPSPTSSNWKRCSTRRPRRPQRLPSNHAQNATSDSSHHQYRWDKRK